MVADDLAVVTSNPTDMRAQIEKIELYCKWSGMQVNITGKDKTALTGRLWGGGESLATMEFTHYRWNARDHRYDETFSTIPHIPPQGVYVYLGVTLNLDLC